MKYFLLFILLSVGLMACNTQKALELDSYDGPKIVFGSSGGFTGVSKEHILLPDGQLFKAGMDGKSRNAEGKIDKNLAKQMISNFKALGFDQLELNDPGNMTYFIDYSENGKNHRVVWGGGRSEIPKELKPYYHTLMGLVKNIKSTPPKM